MYGLARIVAVTYDELIAPGDLAVPEALRVVARAPDAVLLVGATWLLGETVGPLAARRADAGELPRWAVGRAIRQVVTPAGAGTLALTTLVIAVVAIPYWLAVGGTWEHVRGYLDAGVEAIPLAAALLVFVAAWVLGLSVLGAALAWRATAWTALAPSPTVTQSMPPASEPSRWGRIGP